MAFNDMTKVEDIPLTDSRMKRIAAAINKHGRRADTLIEILHMVEESFGYVPLSAMRFVAKEMRVPPSRIYGVVTFYHFFSLKPRGEHTCVVCTGTACHVKGAKQVMDKLEETFKIGAGETTPDGKLGVQVARCLGCCSLGPVVVLDNEIMAKVDGNKVVEAVRGKIGAHS